MVNDRRRASFVSAAPIVRVRRAYFHGTSFEKRRGTGGKETAVNLPVHGCRAS